MKAGAAKEAQTVKNRFLYGTVIKLTREDTPADIERNFIQMREAGFDTAVVWPAFFWWEEKATLMVLGR